MKKESKVCAYSGCVNKAHAKGLCNKHYKASRRGTIKLNQKSIESHWFIHKNKRYQKLVNGWYNLVLGGQ